MDGNIDSRYGSSSCTHTVFETDPWWRGDLGSSQHVSEVFIVNRVGYEARLFNIEIRVGKLKILTKGPLGVWGIKGTWSLT